MATHRWEQKVFWFTFGPNEPAVRVRSGDTVICKTRDALGFDENRQPLPKEMQQRSEDTEFAPFNPQCGPVYVEDASPGDTLAVHIERIALNRPYAWSRHNPNFGFFNGEYPGHLMLFNEPIPEREWDWQLDLERMVGVFEPKQSKIKRIEIPLHPFLGCIAVAPRYGRVETTMAPGEFGGNMDCVETKEGTTVYFPVFVRGAYLEFGDVHAAQGDGEICGVALETTAEVKLRVEVIKGKAIDHPRLEDATHIMTVGNTRPLMDAVRIAHYEMVKWMVEEFGFEKWEAFQVLSQCGTMRVGNVCDPQYTVVCKLPKRILGG